jgi:cation:H+ antiporter
VITALTLLISGLIALALGADRFVLAAARLARAWGVSPILVGALVVGLGTSAPELLVSILAAGRGEIDIALGNVVGSNTANVTLVLGATALVGAVGSRLRTLQREGVLMLVGVSVLTVFCWDLALQRWEALVLAGSMIVAAVLIVWWARSERIEVPVEAERWRGSIPREAVLGIATLAVTLVGSDLVVRGASRLAVELSISSAFVGLVIVSVGTSLPELAAALAAGRRGETDLVIGNVLGSNLFNSLAVAGTAGLVGAGAVSNTFRSALVFMVVSAVLAGFFAFTGRRVARWEGAVLLIFFLGFVAIAV